MKVLLTSGCSFSECISSHIDTWPRHLARLLPDHKHISKAMGSQGNGLISRSIIFECTELLKTIDAKDILVGIMWSGPDRHDFFKEDVMYPDNLDWWMENPTGFVQESKNWIIGNVHWTNNLSKSYYKNFHSSIGSYIYTLEHILRTQWFLEKHNIKYFMTSYTDEVLPKSLSYEINCKHLYDMLNFEYFLPVSSEYNWCDTKSNLPFPKKDVSHPSTEQHKKFVDEVVFPFVKNILGR